MRNQQSLLSLSIAGAVALTAIPVVTILSADAAFAQGQENRNDSAARSENANRSDERPGNSGNAPGRNEDAGDAPGKSDNAPGRMEDSGDAPGRSDNAPGRVSDDDGEEAPEDDGAVEGSAEADEGEGSDRPGNSGNAPGHSDADRPGNGAVARELGNMNAANASATALANADPDSNVGQINAYREEAVETLEAAAAVTAAEEEYIAQLESYDGRSSGEIQQAILELDPASATYTEDLAALEQELGEAQAHEAELMALGGAVISAQEWLAAAAAEEAEILLALTGGVVPSEAALTEFRSRLGL